MNKFAEVLKRLKNSSYLKSPDLSHVEKYLESGDEKDLKAIPRTTGHIYWPNELTNALRPPPEWQDADRRAAKAIFKSTGTIWNLLQWLDNHLPHEKPDEDYLRIISDVASAKPDDIARSAVFLQNLERDGKPTSVGRFLLTLSPAELKAALAKAGRDWDRGRIAGLLAAHAPEKAQALVDDLISHGKYFHGGDGAEALLKRGGERFEPPIAKALADEKSVVGKYEYARVLAEFDRKKYDAAAREHTVACLIGKQESRHAETLAKWLIDHFGKSAAPDLIAFFGKNNEPEHYGEDIVKHAFEKLGNDATPIGLAVLERSFDFAKMRDGYSRVYLQDYHGKTCLAAVTGMLAADAKGNDAAIEKAIRTGFAMEHGPSVIAFLGLAGKWDPKRVEEDVWKLLDHKSKQVRSAAARTLARLGDAALPRAMELLKHKKADTRAAAVTLLTAIASDDSLAQLEARLEEETNDDVRDQMLLGLSAGWEKQGRKLSRKDVEKRIKKSADKIKQPPAKWADPAKLPPLYWTDGSKLSRDAVAYLMFRQSRAKEIKPDVEIAPMFDLIDRKRSGEFAKAIFGGFIGSKQEAADKWAIALAGLLGDDGLVPDMSRQIREWVDKNRGKLAEYGVQALALIGSDVALLAVDAMSIRYRSKMKNVGKAATEAFAAAAEKQGITPEELGDRVVPWLGFEPGKPRVIDAGKSKIEASIGLDMKLAFRDVASGKPIKSLPKTADKNVLGEFKDLAANLREIAKAQSLRLENLLVRQRRWPAKRWKELFLNHPLLLPFAVRLIWGHYDEKGKRLGIFRALPDRTLATNTDDAFNLPDSGTVGMIHPLELSDAERDAWNNHLADYEIEPPFPQMQRDVVRCKPEQVTTKEYKDIAGKTLNAMTFKGRAERLGWYRGSVADAGSVNSYYKSFPAAGCDVFLIIGDFYIGIDMYSDMSLGNVYFCNHGSVKVGSYEYDEPSDANDERLIALGEVHPIVFSEVMGDLQKIAGTKSGEEVDEE